MHQFIIIQYPYQHIEIALIKDDSVLAYQLIHKHDAIGKTIPVIQELLLTHNTSLENISGFGVNVGPGPYNTLRALLTMVNGIHHVTKIPIITSSALDLMSIEHQQTEHVIILQAFENHVFFQLSGAEAQPQAGSIEQLAVKINQLPHSVHAYGNGAIKYQETLTALCGSKIQFTQPISPFNSLETLARATAQKYQAHQYSSDFAKPIYFEDLQEQK